MNDKFKNGFLKSAKEKGFSDEESLAMLKKVAPTALHHTAAEHLNKFKDVAPNPLYHRMEISTSPIEKRVFHLNKTPSVSSYLDNRGKFVTSPMGEEISDRYKKTPNQTGISALPLGVLGGGAVGGSLGAHVSGGGKGALVGAGIGAALGAPLSYFAGRYHNKLDKRNLNTFNAIKYRQAQLAYNSIPSHLRDKYVRNNVTNDTHLPINQEILTSLPSGTLKTLLEVNQEMDKKADDQYNTNDYQQIKDLMASKGFNPEYNMDDTHPYSREYNQKLMQLRDQNYNANPEWKGVRSGVGHGLLGGAAGAGIGNIAGHLAKPFASSGIAKHLPGWGKAVGAAVGALGQGMSHYNQAKGQTMAVKKLTNPMALRQTFDQLSNERQFGNNQIGNYRMT